MNNLIYCKSIIFFVLDLSHPCDETTDLYCWTCTNTNSEGDCQDSSNPGVFGWQNCADAGEGGGDNLEVREFVYSFHICGPLLLDYSSTTHIQTLSDISPTYN